MRSNPCKSCHRSQRIGAGCSQSSRPRCGGCAVARGSCKQAPGSVAPAPHCEPERTDYKRTDYSRRRTFCLCALPCVLCAPLCRGSSDRRSVRGRLCPFGVCPGAARRAAVAGTTTPPAVRPRCCASRPPFAKRLNPYQVACGDRVACQGLRGFLLRDASGLCPVLGLGVIL